MIAFINLKGGVGKTSSCFHLGGALARSGRRVLLVDNDPQASLTQGIVGPDAAAAIPPGSTVAAAYGAHAAPMPEALIVPTPVPGLDLVPGSAAVARWNMVPEEHWGPSERGLRGLLEAAPAGYDLALIDCPPNLHLCSWAALVAADRVVVPLQAEDYGSQGLRPVGAALAAVRSGPNPGLRLAGYLITMFDRRLAVHQGYAATLRELYGAAVFDATVPRAKDFVEAVAMRMPVGSYRPRSAAAKAVAAVADELLVRVGWALAAVSAEAAA